MSKPSIAEFVVMGSAEYTPEKKRSSASLSYSYQDYLTLLSKVKEEGGCYDLVILGSDIGQSQHLREFWTLKMEAPTRLDPWRATGSTLEFTKAPLCATIQTFAPDPVETTMPLSVVIQWTGDSYVATFFDANLSASGDTQAEAFENLKAIIVDTFLDYDEMEDKELGPEPLRQKAVLAGLLRKSE